MAVSISLLAGLPQTLYFLSCLEKNTFRYSKILHHGRKGRNVDMHLLLAVDKVFGTCLQVPRMQCKKVCYGLQWEKNNDTIIRKCFSFIFRKIYYCEIKLHAKPNYLLFLVNRTLRNSNLMVRPGVLSREAQRRSTSF